MKRDGCNWIIETKYHEHSKPDQWKWFNYYIHCNTPLEKLLSEHIKKEGIPLFLPGGECFKKGTVTKGNTKCGREIKKSDLSSLIEKVTLADDKIVIRSKQKMSSSINEETLYKVSAADCKKAQKIENTVSKVNIWEINELSNWFGWNGRVNFPKADNLSKEMRRKIVACKKLQPKDKIHFPHDHICHKTLLDAGDESTIYRLNEYGRLIDIVANSSKIKLVDRKGHDIELKESVSDINKRKMDREKRQWKTGVPRYET